MCWCMLAFGHPPLSPILSFKFIYFWLRWVFVGVRELPLVVASGSYSSLWCEGFSLRWLLIAVASLGAEHGL